MMKEYCANAIAGTQKLLDALDTSVVEKIADRILDSDNVFVVADVGRPGLALMSLAQRLRQLNPKVNRAAGKAKHLPGFRLPRIHRAQRPAQDFNKVRRVVQGKGDQN